MAAKLLAFRRPGRRPADAPVGDVDQGSPKARPTHRPILPSWVRNREERRSAIRWAATHTTHTAAFHAVRSPKYAGRLIVSAPRGAWRVLSSGSRWLMDADGLTVQRHAITSLAAASLGHERSQHTATYRSLAKEHAHRVRSRLMALAFAGLFALGLLPRILGASPLVIALAVGLLGWHGRRKDQPIVDNAVAEGMPARRLTSDMVIRACTAAGLCTDKEPISFIAPVARDGAGFVTTLDLPAGKTAADALKRDEAIASGLGMLARRVFLESVPEEHAGRLKLWVADEDPFRGKPLASPLVKTPRFNFWDPIPVGVDARGRSFSARMIWTSFLCGSVPRKGKTNLMRLIASAAALDPHVQLVIADGKGGADWLPFEKVAHWYASGVRGGVVEALAETLEGLIPEMDRRYGIITKLVRKDRALAPDAKITPAISRATSHRMPLLLVILDEFQEYGIVDGYGPRIIKALQTLAKVAPGAGMMFMIGTQKPDADSLPSGLRDQFVTRAALHVPAWQVSDVILGAGARRDGADASTIPASHLGVAVFKGAGDESSVDHAGVKVRCHYADLVDLDVILDRARELRIAAGTLSGMAAGEDLIAEAPAPHLLEDVQATFRGEAELWSEVICERLALANPDAYSGWTPTRLAQALGPHGVKTTQIWDAEAKRNRRGVTHEDVLAAMAAALDRTGR
ncbi:MAG: cell division protein FtsK/SpoIIIE [Acidimicrobiales bacterium]|nr:cell division protein FtsK/SpoIIIE [Acidimicrobiales bacterium]